MVIYTDDDILYAALSRRVENEKCHVMHIFERDADIAAAGRRLTMAHNAEILLINSEKLPEIDGFGKARRLVSCGMSEKDTVNFSSIDADRAVLCVQRGIVCGNVQLESGEYPVEYDRNLSIYNNIVLSICKMIT